MNLPAPSQPRPEHDPQPLTLAELDALADWSVGELAGPEAARIAELVRADARWAAAHAALGRAEPAVRASLQSAAAAAEPMPDDVVARLTSALGAAPPESATLGSGPGPAGGAGSRGPRHARATTPTHAPAGHGGPRRPPGPRPAPRARSRRGVLTGLAVVLVALLGYGGFAIVRGASFAGSNSNASSNGNGDIAPAVGSAPEPTSVRVPQNLPGTAAEGGGIVLFASGFDYHHDTLAQIATMPRLTSAPLTGADGTYDSSLSTLSTNPGLEQCLEAVRVVQPGVVLAGDFARYEGNPALILLVRDGNASTAVAVGPSCGVAGADELAAVDAG